MYKESLLDWLRRLVWEIARAIGKPTEDHFGLQRPLCWHSPELIDLRVNQWVVVLQVSTKAFRLERSPEHILVHARCVIAPRPHVVGVLGQFCLKLFDHIWVFVEEDLEARQSVCITCAHWTSYCAVTCVEAANALLRALELVFWSDGLENVESSVPELVVILAKEDDETSGLRVEGTWRLQKSFLKDLSDA